MKSSLEIAQGTEPAPIEEIAERCGLEPDEIEPYGRDKAKVSLSVIKRLAEVADGKLVCVSGMTPTKGGEGKTTTCGRAYAGARRDRQGARTVPARAIARAGVRHQGRRRRAAG